MLAEDEDSPTEINGAPNDVAEEDEASELKSFPKQLNINYNGKEIGYNYDTIDVKIATKKLLVRKLRQKILTTGQRSDGRRVNEVRPLYMETSLLPNAHGSSLFTRYEIKDLCRLYLSVKLLKLYLRVILSIILEVKHRLWLRQH